MQCRVDSCRVLLRKKNDRRNGSGTVRHGIGGSVNTIGLRGTVLAWHSLKRRAGTVLRSTGSQCKLKRYVYRAKRCACVQHIHLAYNIIIFGLFLRQNRPNSSL